MSKQYAVIRRGETFAPVAPSIDLDLHQEDIKQRSIAPTTHKFRDIYKDITDLQQIVVGGSVVPADLSNAMFYCDTYYHPTWKTEVLHFGINGHSALIKSVVSQHNISQRQAMTAPGTSVISNASNATGYSKFVKQIELTTYEREIVTNAINFLTTSVKKLILVDTFPRELKPNASKGLNVGDIEIPLDPSLPIPTHTVVLYKSLAGQFLVIDPNSPQFSGHLQHIITCCLSVSDSASLAHKPYSPGITNTSLKTGPDKAKYRDCVDISVKLAALLDQDPTDYTSLDQVMRSDAVKLVSNNKDITGLVITGKTLRVKQVSDLTEMKNINTQLQDQLLRFVTETDDAKAIFDAEKLVLQQQYNTKMTKIIGDYDIEVTALMGQAAINPALGGDYDT